MSEPISLREVLAREFGVELPIGGGSGTQAAPIVVTTTDLQRAVDAQMQVLGCVATLRRVAWRLVAQEVVEHVGKVVQTTIETVAHANTEVLTQLEAIHFLLEALPDDGTSMELPVASGFEDPRSGVRLPRQLGWMHLQGATESDAATPGLDWSVAYGSPVLKGTVYIYDRGNPLSPEGLDSERVIEEFRDAVADVLSGTQDAQLKQQALIRDSAGAGRCYLAFFDLPGESMSTLLLTVQRACFVKARLTFNATERRFGQMAHESMEAFMDAVRPGPSTIS